jgi:hypothetical protein
MTIAMSIRTSGVVAAACASVAAISVLPAASASASVPDGHVPAQVPRPGASASPRPVIYGLPDGASGPPWSNFVNPQIRPTSAIRARNTVILVFDGEWIVFHRWSSWKSASAYGSGTLYVRKLGGGPTRSSPAGIHLYRVKRHDGRRYFTRLHFTLRHRVYAQRSATAKFSPRFPPAWRKS